MFELLQSNQSGTCRWMDIYADLTNNMGGVQCIEPEEAARKAESG